MTAWYKRVAECRHESTITVISAGIERVVCENCGDVTIRYESSIDGEVSRAKFARDADRIHAARLVAAERS